MHTTLSLIALASLAACTTHPSPTAGLVTSLQLDLLAPMAGSPAAPNTDRAATFNLTALGDDGQPYPGDATINLYVSYGGVLTGIASDCGVQSDAPIETFTLSGGTLQNHNVMLPVAYGTTSIWVEETGSHVVGASDPIYFPNPTVQEVQTPPDPTAPNATFCTNFNKKFVTVDHPASPTGDLLVDSLFDNAFTVTDTSTSDYRSIYVFSYSHPHDDIVPGRHIKSFNGNISKFVGFTEVNFPIVIADDDAPVEPQKLPAPIKLVQTDTANVQKLNAANSAVVEVTGKVCPTNPPNPNNDPNIQSTIDQWVKYDTFVLGAVSCDSFTEFAVALPSKVVGTFDPTMMVGQTATVRGMLRNSSGQNPVTDASGAAVTCDAQTPCITGTCDAGICKKAPYNFWTVTVRDQSDLPQ